MKKLFINLENNKIIIENNKNIIEFNNINDLKNSGIIQKDKLKRLIESIGQAKKLDISFFKFNL